MVGKMRRRHFIGYIASAIAAAPRIVSAEAKNRPIVLGVFPRRNIKITYRFFTPLVKYLSFRLNRKVVLKTTKSFQEFWGNVQQKNYDIVHFNQYHYIVSHKLYNYQVIAANKELDSSTIAGSIVVRKDSGINSVSDLKGKTILFGGSRRAMQSYIGATWLLRNAGLQAGDYIEKFSINPPNTIISTYFKRADAAGSGDSVMYLDNVRNRIDINELKILAQTKQMTHLPWAVNDDLSVVLREKIQHILTTLNDHAEGKAVLKSAHLSDILLAIDSDFDEHRKIITDVYGADFGVSTL